MSFNFCATATLTAETETTRKLLGTRVCLQHSAACKKVVASSPQWQVRLRCVPQQAITITEEDNTGLILERGSGGGGGRLTFMQHGSCLILLGLPMWMRQHVMALGLGPTLQDVDPKP